ncbi:MAG: hypothetical protein Q4D51_07515 [Eubacteriales bacterium]|nr:hypothetical protein [Eubacteriales bacterium]
MRKHLKIHFYLIAMVLLVLIGAQTVYAKDDCGAAVTTKQEVMQMKASKKKKPEYRIKKKNGRKICYNRKGKRVRKQFVTIHEKTFYFGANSVMQKGWIKVKGEYYYLDRSSGQLQKNCKVDGIKLRKSGKAVKTEYNVKKITTMMTAREIMTKNTKFTDTKQQKLMKMFMWVMKHPYKRYRTIRSARVNKGWEMVFANDVYKSGQGCCVSEACAFAFLAHECGYKDVYVCDDTGHAWTEINGKVYDTLFAEAKNGGSYEHPDFKHYYGASYSVAKLYHGPLMGKKKI